MSVKKAIKAITLLLGNKYPNIEVADREIEHALLPCFYIDVIEVKENRLSQFITEQTISFELVYFAELLYTGYIELLTKQGEITELLQQLIPIDDDYVLASDLDFNVNRKDYVLSTMFALSIQGCSKLIDINDTNENMILTLNKGIK